MDIIKILNCYQENSQVWKSNCCEIDESVMSPVRSSAKSMFLFAKKVRNNEKFSPWNCGQRRSKG